MKLQDSSHTCTYSVALSDLDITINKIWNLKGNVQYLWERRVISLSALLVVADYGIYI